VRLFRNWRKSVPEREQRWVVVDVETSGMDSASDALISIGAVAIVEDRIRPADSIELIVRQGSASAHGNILVHGIGAHAQLNGTDPRQAVQNFLEYVGAAPLLAFHAPFDRGFLARAVSVWGELPFDNPWLDLAELAPALVPKARIKSLDEWLQHFGIPLLTRHSAAADAFATALLTIRLLPLARAQGVQGLRALRQLARDARWLQ
jgi:DNA polymerase-3 subunit epsilon